MFKYYFVENKLVYFDVDIAEEFDCDVSLIREIVTTNKPTFLDKTIFTLNKTMVNSIKMVQGREFKILPEIAFTSSAIFLLSIYCCTQKSIESAKKLLTTIEEKDQFDIVKAMNNLSANINSSNDTSEALKQIIKIYIIEILQDLNIKSQNARSLV